MRLLTLFCVLSFTIGANAITLKPVQQKAKAHMDKILKTNNSLVYLESIKGSLSKVLYKTLKKQILAKKNKMYDVKRVSPYAVEIKFSGNRWVRMSFDIEKGGFYIKDEPFRWNFKDTNEVNLAKLKLLIDKKYPKKKTVFNLFKFIPSAEAWLFGNGNDDIPTLMTGTTAAEAPVLDYDSFMLIAERQCGYHESAVLSFNDPSVYFEASNRSSLQQSFRDARDLASNLQGSAHGWGFYRNRRLIGSFGRVQDCFRERGYIADTDTIEIDWEMRGNNPVGDLSDH